MRKYILISILLITSLCASTLKEKNILLLHSFDYQYPWTKSIYSGIDKIQKESSIPIKFFIEQIDLKKIDLKDKDKWTQYFSNKYKDILIDGIAIDSTDAIMFMNEYGNMLFKNIPKVFYGNVREKEDKSTIYIENEISFAIEGTVKEALVQNKNVENIYSTFAHRKS